MKRRLGVIRRYGRMCYLCWKPIRKGQRVTSDHRVPRAAGGTQAYGNLQPAHYRCNVLKDTLMLPALYQPPVFA